MNNEVCIHGGVLPVNLLRSLHQSQAGSGRHRCPTCAYEQGFNLGSSKTWISYKDYTQSVKGLEACVAGSRAPANILKRLGETQGGSGRHKCTNCAFKEGFEAALKNSITIPTGKSPDLVLVATPSEPMFPSNNHSISTKIDFFEEELKNRHLGNLGELFIFNHEVNRLNKISRSDLAAKVTHVSITMGDGLGYDILSFDENGNEMWIEVKTTRAGINRAFYLSRNEIDVSSKNSNKFYLFRLFDFDSEKSKGKYYCIKGDLNKLLKLEPLLYKALPK